MDTVTAASLNVRYTLMHDFKLVLYAYCFATYETADISLSA